MRLLKKKNLDDLLLTPEQVIQELEVVKTESRGSVTTFIKILKKRLGATFDVLKIQHDSIIHRFVYRGFLTNQLTSEDVFELIVALNQDKGHLTRSAFERLLPLLSESEWHDVLNNVIIPEEQNVPLISGFVLSYPSFLEKSGLSEATLQSFLLQALAHWHYFANQQLKSSMNDFLGWIESENANHSISTLLRQFLALNDLDLTDMLTTLVRAWLSDDRCSEELRMRLLELLQRDGFVGELVMIGSFRQFVMTGTIERDVVKHWINRWIGDERVDIRRKCISQLPTWWESRIVDDATAERMLKDAVADSSPHVRRELVPVVFTSFDRQLLSFENFQALIDDLARDASPHVKEALFRYVSELNVEKTKLIAVLESIEPVWRLSLQETVHEEFLLTAALELLKLYYYNGLVTATDVRLLIRPLLEASKWEIRHATILMLPFLITEGIYAKDEIQLLFRKEKHQTIKKVLEKQLLQLR